MRKKITTTIIALIFMLTFTLGAKLPDQIVDNRNVIKEEIQQEINVLAEEEKKVIEQVPLKEEEETNNWIVDFTQEELEIFQKLTFAESGIEDEEFQVAVAATILNRIESGYYANDLYGVMNQKNAFSSVKDGKIYIMTQNPYEVTLDMIPEKTKNATIRALEGEDPTEESLKEEARRLGLDKEYFAEGGALYFYNPDACDPKELNSRENIQVKVRIGCHYYYKVWG